MFLFFSYQIKTPVEAVIPLPPHFQLPAPHSRSQTPKSQARESPPAGAGLPGALSRLLRSPLGTDAPDAQALGAARGTGGFRASAGVRAVLRPRERAQRGPPCEASRPGLSLVCDGEGRRARGGGARVWGTQGGIGEAKRGYAGKNLAAQSLDFRPHSRRELSN